MPVSKCYHRLDSNTETTFQHRSVTTSTIVRYLRIFVHVLANTMTYKLTNNSIRTSLAILLDGITDVSYTFAVNSIFNSDVKCFFCGFQQLTNIVCNLTDTKSISGISAKAIHVSSTIHRNDIPVFQYHITGDAMHNLLVD